MKSFFFLKTLLLILVVVNFSACREEITLADKIDHYPQILETHDIRQVKQICTPHGLEKLVEWTDSLRKEELIQFWADNISALTYEYTQPDDSTFRLMISDRTGVSRESSTFLIRLRDGEAKIDDYMGGIVVNRSFHHIRMVTVLVSLLDSKIFLQCTI